MTGAVDERGLLAEIKEHPEKDGVRLIYADWLEDHAGQQQNEQTRAAFNDKAEFIRIQIGRVA